MKNQITLPSINAPQLSKMATTASAWTGNPETMQRCSQTVLRLPVKSSNANLGILLALDGLCLEPPALPDTLQLCRSHGNRLDILLLNAPKPATLILGKLLRQLEKEGIDYRLSGGEGALADELPVYLHRFKYISFVVLNCLDKWDARLHTTLHALSLEGYKVLTKLAPDHTAPLSPQLA
jgi:hypothetical protein